MRVLADFYLDYVNNFLTVDRFAEYHGLSVSDANKVISIGKKYHEKRVQIQTTSALST